MSDESYIFSWCNPELFYTKRYILKINDAPEDKNKIMFLNIKLLHITSRHRQNSQVRRIKIIWAYQLHSQTEVCCSNKPNLENIQAKQTNGEALKYLKVTLTVVIK